MKIIESDNICDYCRFGSGSAQCMYCINCSDVEVVTSYINNFKGKMVVNTSDVDIHVLDRLKKFNPK